MPSLRQRADGVEHLVDQLGIERRGHFVEQQDLGLQRQRPGDRDALLLAARELVGIGVMLVGEADLGEKARRLAPRHRPCGRFLILIGAMVTLRITSMFWNRLYCWKTIAMRSRAARSSARER